MKILVALNHPAHFHLFKYVAKELSKNGHKLLFVYKQKDILEELLMNFEFDSIRISEKSSTSKSKISIFKNRLSELLTQDINLFKVIRKFHPDLMIGTDISISHIGRFSGIPSLIFNEDDIEINKLFCYSSYPFANHIISPGVCNVARFGEKKISYNGYQKLAYLHPSRFLPDRSIVQKYIVLDKPYYLIRLVSFTAGHDVEQKHGGLTGNLIQELVYKFSGFGNVYISSESPVEKEFEKYLLKIGPIDMHHFIYYSDMLIADSQSMIVESAMLGTPSIRFNSFVGKISVLEELEKKYSLTFGIHNSSPELLLTKIDEFLSIKDLKGIFRNRQQKMLEDKIDVTSFFVWFIENYPASIGIMKKNPDFQYNFR
jgi:uncharacterized protein